MQKHTTAPRYRATSNLEAVLAEQGRRKDWLAIEVGVSPATVTRIVTGTRGADEAVAQRIAKALGVPLFLLFELPISDESSLVGSNGKAVA